MSKTTKKAPKKAVAPIKTAPVPVAAPAAQASSADKPGVETQGSASLKNFRHQPEMENFYRFIYENDLRFEALAILDQMVVEKRNRKKAKAARSKLQ